jgi:alkylhydroperoxidase family enzyme
MSSKPRVTPPASTGGNIISDSALGLVPETLVPYMQLNWQIWNSGPLSPAEIEMARLRNARTVNCVFCKSVRYDVAVAAGLTETKVDMIDDEYANSELSPREKLIIEYTDCYLQHPASLGAELQQRMLAEFNAAEIAHLSLAIAHFNGFSRCAVALGGMPDELPIMEISVPE